MGVRVCVGKLGGDESGETSGVGGCTVALVGDVLFRGGEEVALFDGEV